MAYYCVREPDLEHNDTKLIIHREGKDGPVIATADPCGKNRKYETDIHLLEYDITIPFEHKHETQLFCSFRNLFHWKGHKDLKEGGDSEIVATFEPSPFRGNIHKIKVGDLCTNKQLEDLVMITALVAQEKSEETQSPVNSPYSLILNFIVVHVLAT